MSRRVKVQHAILEVTPLDTHCPDSLSHSTCHKKTRVNNFDQCIDHHVRTSAVHASSLGLSPSFACAGAPATIPRLASAYLQDLKRLKGIPALAKGSKDTVRASSSSCNSRRKSVQKKKPCSFCLLHLAKPAATGKKGHGSLGLWVHAWDMGREPSRRIYRNMFAEACKPCNTRPHFETRFAECKN